MQLFALRPTTSFTIQLTCFLITSMTHVYTRRRYNHIICIIPKEICETNASDCVPSTMNHPNGLNLVLFLSLPAFFDWYRFQVMRKNLFHFWKFFLFFRTLFFVLPSPERCRKHTCAHAGDKKLEKLFCTKFYWFSLDI